jgi:hypothetical protein
MNKKELLLISIGIFLTVVCWLIADIYHASVYSKNQYQVESMPSMSSYEINKDVLNKLSDKNE